MFKLLVIEFACNGKSSAISVLVFFCSSFLLSSFLDGLPKLFLGMFNHWLPRKCETKTRLISLGTLKVCITNVFEDVIPNMCDPCNAMSFTLITITSITASEKLQKSDT